MGAFPEDGEIKTSTLVRMWIAEGFVKTNVDKRSLEEEAEDYLKALVERNLILVRHFNWNGEAMSLSMHDLVRDLCISIGIEDKFLHVKHDPDNLFTISVNTRRVFCDGPLHHAYDSTLMMMPHVRSFVSTGKEILSPVLCAAFRLLIGISRLWNLQTLIARLGWGFDYMPCEIWEMSELRHVELGGRIIFEEEDGNGNGNGMMKKHVLKNLQTLSGIMISSASPMWMEDFFQRFPNITKLPIYYYLEEVGGGVVDISHLHKLEKLLCDFENRSFVSTIRFPSSLRSLTLNCSYICSRELSTLCDLPNLEALIISDCKIETDREEDEEEWELGEEDVFRSLRFLHLQSCTTLVRWRADETNFPILRRLFISYCFELQEIPSSIGEIPTLQLIDLYYCNTTVEASAKQILEVQQSDYCNYQLQLRIDYHGGEIERERASSGF